MNGLTCPNCRSPDTHQIEEIEGIGYLEEVKGDSLVVYGPHLQMLQGKAFIPEKIAKILLICGRCHAVWPL